MAARLALVFGILFANPMLAARPFPLTWQLPTDPISLGGQVSGSFGNVPLGPFQGSGSWEVSEPGVSGSGAVAVSVENGLVRISHSGTMSGDFVHLNFLGPLGVDVDIPDLGESTTTLVFATEAETNVLSGTGDFSSASLSISGDDYDSSTLAMRARLASDELFLALGSNSISGTVTSWGGEGALLPFVAGDRAHLPLFVAASVECFGENCSVSWSQTLVLKGASAIAPEPQNRPQTQCFDQADNDGDGQIDLTDSDCTDPYDRKEAPLPMTTGCGSGPELVLLLPGLWGLRGLARRSVRSLAPRASEL